MANNIHTELGGINKRFKRKKDRLMTDIAKEVLTHQKSNFNSEGFNGQSYKKWKDRARPKPRKILVGVSAIHMKDSTKVVRAKFPTVILTNAKGYADQHQDGRGIVPQRQFMSKGYGGDAPKLDRRIDKRIDTFVKVVIGRGR